MSAKLAKGVSLTEIEGKAVLFAMRTGDTFGLSETAAVFLRALLKGTFESAVVGKTSGWRPSSIIRVLRKNWDSKKSG